MHLTAAAAALLDKALSQTEGQRVLCNWEIWLAIIFFVNRVLLFSFKDWVFFVVFFSTHVFITLCVATIILI